MTREYRAFHGTTREGASNIVRTRYINFSNDDEEWLGKGIYFFDEDVKQAYYFCIKARKYSEWAIIYSHIETDNYIDLTILDHYEQFKEIANKLKTRYLKRADGRPRKLMNAVILNAMYKLKPYDLVRAIFPVPPGYPIERTNIYPYEYQICVKNRNCIKTIEEVNYEHKAI